VNQPAEPQNPPDKSVYRICRKCGATIGEDDRFCWLCGANLDAPDARLSVPTPRVSTENERTFALSTLLLIVTGICVCLGLCVAAPGVGILVSVVIAPALLRTWATSHRQHVAGLPVTVGEGALAFFGSVAVVLLAVLAAFAAFFVTCLVSLPLGAAAASANWEESTLVAIVGLSSLAAIFAFVWLMRIFWPKRRRLPQPQVAEASPASGQALDIPETPHDAS
jgi:hypothetical protein